MTTKPSDLIAIANPTLARKLADDPEQSTHNDQNALSDANEGFHKSFKKEIWRAVYTLNIIRYLVALFFLGLAGAQQFYSNIDTISSLTHPRIFLLSTIILLVSAVCFTVFTKTRRFALNSILVTQFTVDLVIAALLTHATGSIGSGFALLFLMVVTTGSVVLSRKNALALASGAIILLFYEHFYSVWIAADAIKAKPGLLAAYGLLLFFSGWMVSLLAQKLRAAEMRTYIPSHESIEEYLMREEIRALKSALASTNGNKTEAAKVLGMTFRSFRYKLTKYDIG